MFDLALAEKVESPELISSGLFAAFDVDAMPEAMDPFGADRHRKTTHQAREFVPPTQVTIEHIEQQLEALDFDGLQFDADCIPMFDSAPRWNAMSLQQRLFRASRCLDNMLYYQLLQERKEGKKPAKAAKRFSTDYAVAHGRKQGWKLIEREYYDFRMKRHHDCEMAADAIFDDHAGGRIGIQGAGKYEREKHRQKFDDLGGVEKARSRGFKQFLYMEFERGNKTAILTEDWLS